MSLYCVDSQIVVWGIKQVSSLGQEDMIPRAKLLFEKFETEKHKLILPAPVLTEILVPVPIEKHSEFLDLIQSKFRIADVDAAVSVRAAQIWSERSTDEELKKYRTDNNIAKDKMKFDFQIAAIAITKGCDAIYSHDPHIHRFVGDLIPVLQVPELPRPTANLFTGTGVEY
jgi:hypothetical protein